MASKSRPAAALSSARASLDIDKDGAVPDDVEAQARLCFRGDRGDSRRGRHGRLPISCGSTPMSTGAEYLAGYMKVRDEFVGDSAAGLDADDRAGLRAARIQGRDRSGRGARATA